MFFQIAVKAYLTEYAQLFGYGH